MSDILDGIINNSSLNSDYSFVDADTIRDAEGTSYRLQGFDSPEVMKFMQGEFSAGTAGGADATQALQRLAKDQGFTNVVVTGDAAHGRKEARLTNNKGEDFTTRLLQSGVLNATKDTRQQDLDAMHVAQALGDKLQYESGGEFADTAKLVKDAMVAQGHDDLNFKEQATTEWQKAQMVGALKAQGYSTDEATKLVNNQAASGVGIKTHGRNEFNQSLNPMTDAWDTSWIGVTEASYGFLELIGDTAGLESLKDIGEDGIARARGRIADQASFILDTEEVEDLDTAFQWLGNNIAMSLPYMAITMGGTIAAPFTMGASLAAPVAVYTGQTWNEMEGEKNAGAAVIGGVVQATLDRLGLGGVIKGSGTGALKKAVTEYAKRNNVTDAVAKKAVMDMTKLEMAKLAGNAAEIAKSQLKAKALLKDFVKRGLVSGSSEGITEALQEATAYIAATAGSDKEYDPAELLERMQKAAIAGSVIGGAFAVPGAAYDAGAWTNIAVGQSKADEGRLSTAGRYAEEELKNEGRVMSIEEITAENHIRPEAVNDLETRIQMHEHSEKSKDWKDKTFDAITSAPALWQGATRWIFRPEVLERSRTARKMADMFGGQLQRTFSGSNYESAKHHKVSIYKNLVDTPETAWANLIGKDRGLVNRQRKIEASKHVYNVLRAAVDKKGRFNPNLIPKDTKNRDYIIQFAKQLQTLGDRMHGDQAKYNQDLGYLQNYLFKYKAFDKKAIADNKDAFIDQLTTTFADIDKVEARKIADAIIDNDTINDIDEAFSTVKGNTSPTAHKKRSLGLSERAEFDQFMQHDIFANVSQAAKSAARYSAHQQYIGDQGKQIAKMLDQMEVEGVPTETVNKIAKQMKDYIDAESGNYKRPTSETGKKLQTIQRNFMAFTMFAGLPLATVSSIVELALTMKGLNANQIFGKGGIKTIAEEGAKGIWGGMQKAAHVGREFKDFSDNKTDGQRALQDLGYYSWDVGAATTTGATEITPTMQNLADIYFKAIGLQQWTDYTRAIRAALAGDYISEKAQLIQNAQGQEKTNEIQEAEEALRNLGLNVPIMMQAMNGNASPEVMAQLEMELREAQYNFINEAVALPGSANRPLIYQDPRFALFTQFQGFIATFTANHIPKMWGEYVKRGTPAMKYNAFAVMATMILLGFVSQYLKDLIKFGEDSPYLDDAQYIQRGVRASGLLGAGERVLDQFFPLYESNSQNAGEWIFNSATGESPAASNLQRLGKSAGKFIEGDVGEGTRNLLKAAPLTGPFSGLNSYIGEKMSAWNFKGE